MTGKLRALAPLFRRLKNTTSEQKAFLLHSALATLFKVLSAGMAFFLNIFAARTLGSEAAGLFFLGLSLATLFGTLSLAGMDNGLVRFMGKLDEKKQYKEINRIFTQAYLLVLPVSVLVGIGLYFLSPFLAHSLFEKPELAPSLGYFSFSIPFISVFLLNGYALQARREIIASLCSMQLGVSFFMIICLLMFKYLQLDVTPERVAQFFLGVSMIVAILGLQCWFHAPNRKFDTSGKKNAALWKAAPHFWVICVAGQAIPWGCVVIVGFFVSSENIAFFSSALRTSLLISFMLTVVNFVAAPRFSTYWQAGQLDKLQQLAQYSTRFMFLVSIPILLTVFLFPSQIMSLFGDDFSKAATPLLLLCIGQTVNLFTGPVGFLLCMCGHEQEMRNLTVFSGFITILLLVSFTFLWGIIGSAIAMSLGIITQNLLAIYQVKNKLGFWPF